MQARVEALPIQHREPLWAVQPQYAGTAACLVYCQGKLTEVSSSMLMVWKTSSNMPLADIPLLCRHLLYRQGTVARTS